MKSKKRKNLESRIARSAWPTLGLHISQERDFLHRRTSSRNSGLRNSLRSLKSNTGVNLPVEQLGGGWVAEEAVAIALYCVLVCSSFDEAILLAVNHSGDSDSTGSITGNLWGVMHGVSAISAKWTLELELHEEIIAVADDLFRVCQETLELESSEIWSRYPGY